MDPFKPSSDAAAGAVGGAHNAGGFSVLGYVRRRIPDPRSRWAFLFALLGAVALSLWWLINTVQNKWIYSNQHPQQIITFERVTSLPALFGLSLVYYNYSVPADANLFRRVTPLWSRFEHCCVATEERLRRGCCEKHLSASTSGIASRSCCADVRLCCCPHAFSQ